MRFASVSWQHVPAPTIVMIISAVRLHNLNTSKTILHNIMGVVLEQENYASKNNVPWSSEKSFWLFLLPWKFFCSSVIISMGENECLKNTWTQLSKCLHFQLFPHEIPSSQASGINWPNSRATFPECPGWVHYVILISCLKYQMCPMNEM